MGGFKAKNFFVILITAIAIILSIAIVSSVAFLTFTGIITANNTSVNSGSTSNQLNNNSDFSSEYIDWSDYSDFSSIDSSYISFSDISSSEYVSSNGGSSSNPSSSSVPSSGSSSVTPTPKPPVVQKTGLTKAIWYSTFNLYELIFEKYGYKESTFKNKINEMFDNAVSIGADTVVCHVRGYADAYYPSKYFPWSAHITGVQGKDPGYDPLEIMINAAHDRGLDFHAWLNPYRISTSTTDHNTLSADHPARIWANSSDANKQRNVLKVSSENPKTRAMYFNPTKPESQQLIINGIREILDNYDVDGIHIDDYFYPVTDLDFDGVEFAEYKAQGGKLSQADWRRANVSTLVQGIYSVVHSYSNVVFGVSPSYHISTNGTDDNYTKQYADLAKWMKTPGYIDYIVPQIYFGYEHKTADFTKILNNWLAIPKHDSLKLHIGLAPYKIGTTDGESDEWKTNNMILANQANDAHDKGCNGIFLFDYQTLFNSDSTTTAQRNNLANAIKSIK